MHIKLSSDPFSHYNNNNNNKNGGITCVWAYNLSSVSVLRLCECVCYGVLVWMCVWSACLNASYWEYVGEIVRMFKFVREREKVFECVWDKMH